MKCMHVVIFSSPTAETVIYTLEHSYMQKHKVTIHISCRYKPKHLMIQVIKVTERVLPLAPYTVTHKVGFRVAGPNWKHFAALWPKDLEPLEESSQNVCSKSACKLMGQATGLFHFAGQPCQRRPLGSLPSPSSSLPPSPHPWLT